MTFIQGMERDTLPPTSDDAAALEYGRHLSEVADRTADFWACVERQARIAGITPHALSDDQAE